MTRLPISRPRARILSGPTPIELAPRLSDLLGVEIRIKRDDLAGPAFGGNKSRQLEYCLGAAEAEGADTVLITGAVQSNFVRTAAAAAARLGMETIVQLEDRVGDRSPDYNRSGNVLLAQILGAEVVRYPRGEDEAGADRALRERAEALRARGRRPYVIPLGLGNAPLGALGYMRAAEEILDQQEAAFDLIVTPSGSALTHSGLLAGLRALGDGTRVVGGCVRRPAAAQIERLKRVIGDLKPLVDEPFDFADADIEARDGALAPGYGKIGPPAAAAMRLAARTEGLLLDPVYTAKAFATLIELVEEGAVPRGGRALFVHTGGLAALFAYADPIRAALEASELV
ncbi:MAG: D-cysteine desulfhydrase family protein [Pseudomonadota bacterium]